MTAHTVLRVRRTAQNTQYTYNLTHRVHDVKTYPVLSPQGATILIYGHENGLTLVWRGGKPLKAPKSESTSEASSRDKRNGGAGGGGSGGSAAADAVMIIDSDEDEAPPPPPKPFVDKPEFENAGAEDGREPDVIQTLDLSLGTAVRHIAVLPMPHCSAEEASWGGAEVLLGKRMVFAVTCLTADVCVISLPLTPPSHESKARLELKTDLLASSAGRGMWGETLIPLVGQVQHSDGVAITLAKQRQQPTTGRGSKTAGQSSSQTTRIIVAAHSRQATGVLRLWDVMVGLEKLGSAERPLEPFQTEFLPSPLTGLSFNPTHITQLLTVASPHAVRIYDYSLPSVPPDESDGPLPSQGSWLLSLYPPFIRTAGISTARKPVVAAGWIVHGRAILALLADGQWGIWDIDGAGPAISGTSSGLFSKATSGVRGAALATFSASGYLDGFSPLRNPGSQRPSGDLAPMTPHTRRDVVASSLSGGPERLATVRGGIEVVQLPQSSSSRAQGDDESVVLWLGGGDHVVAIIPVLGRFWDAQIRRGSGGGVNLFSGAQPTRMIRLTDLNMGLLGERCTGVGAIPRPSRPSAVEAADGSGSSHYGGGLPIDVLVRGESRLVVVREADDAAPTSSLGSKLLGTRKRMLGGPAVAAASKQVAAAPAAAIVVHPRPGNSAAPNHAALAQSIRGIKGGSSSVRGRASLFGKRPADEEDAEGGELAALVHRSPTRRRGLPAFEDDDDNLGAGGPSFTQSMLSYASGIPATTPADAAAAAADDGLAFAGQLSDAADVTYDEDADNERDVEREVLDIMEIDRALDGMEEDRGSGAKHVFFENTS